MAVADEAAWGADLLPEFGAPPETQPEAELDATSGVPAQSAVRGRETGDPAQLSLFD